MSQARRTWLLVEENDAKNDTDIQARAQAAVEQAIENIEQEELNQQQIRVDMEEKEREKSPQADIASVPHFNDRDHALTLIKVDQKEMEYFPDRQISDFLSKYNNGESVPPLLSKALKGIRGDVHSLVQVNVPERAQVGDKCRYTHLGVSANIWLEAPLSNTLTFALHDRKQSFCSRILGL